MNNAAMKRATRSQTSELNRTIRFQKMGQPSQTMRMGNFVYERDSGAGGPFILTLLQKADRADPNNEPILVISNVVEFEPDPTEEPEAQ